MYTYIMQRCCIFFLILTHALKQLMDIGKYKTDSLIRQG